MTVALIAPDHRRSCSSARVWWGLASAPAVGDDRRSHPCRRHASGDAPAWESPPLAAGIRHEVTLPISPTLTPVPVAPDSRRYARAGV